MWDVYCVQSCVKLKVIYLISQLNRFFCIYINNFVSYLGFIYDKSKVFNVVIIFIEKYYLIYFFVIVFYLFLNNFVEDLEMCLLWEN